jgi:hypothetical protein
VTASKAAAIIRILSYPRQRDPRFVASIVNRIERSA